MTVTAQDIITPVNTLVASYIRELGNTESARNSVVLNYISLALRKLANVAYQAAYSDTLNIIADGDQTFLKSGGAIDLYAPLRILNSSNQAVVKRTSQEAPTGWWRESSNMPINTKGMTGNHVLHYIKYPANVSAPSSPVEFPEAATLGLMYYVCALIMESRPDAKQIADHYYGLASQHLKVAVLANEDGRGKSSGGFVPSVNIIDQYYKG